MYKYLLLGVSILLISCQENKVGYVDYAELMNQYDAKKALEATFQQKAQKFARKRDSISQMFQREAQSFQPRAQSMNASKAQEEYANLQTRGQQIGQQLQMEEQLIQEEGSQKMDSLLKDVRERIENYGNDNGFTYIFAGGEGGTVLYGSKDQNLTDKILTYLQASKQ
jgi:outer membrane protein